jgi:hypothetical protein
MKNFMSVVTALYFVLFNMNAQAQTAATLPQANVVSDTMALVEFKGKYNFENGAPVPNVTVRIEKEGLVAVSAQGDFALKAIEGKADNFTIAEIGAEVVFTRNENKKITSISVKMEDGTIVAKKEEIK